MQAGWRRGAGGVAVGWLIAGVALADVPDRINYQGRLVTSSNLVNGTVSLVLRLYDAETGGTLRYADSNRVTVVDGLYATWLGDNTIAGTLTNALAQPQVWVELVVNGSRLSPRERLGSVPYALNANAAAGLSTVNPTFAGVVTAAGFAGDGSRLTRIDALDAPAGGPANVVVVNGAGRVGIGTNAPVAGLHIAGSGTLFTPKLVAEIVDGVGGFSRLSGANSVQVVGATAYVSAYNDDALTIMDVSNPVAPVKLAEIVDEVGGFNRLGGVRSVHVVGTTAYVAADRDDALTIIDVSNPAAPVKQAEIVDGVGGFGGLQYPTCVYVVDSTAYVAAYDDDALTIIDVSNPAAPVKQAEIVDGVGGFNRLNGVHAVHVVGSTAYVAAYNDDALTIIDASNPAAPVKQAEIVDGVGGFNRLNGAVSVHVVGATAYVAAYDDNALTIIDVSNPTVPVKQAEIVDGIGGFNRLGGVRSVYVVGTTAYVAADADNALTIIDVSNPALPVKLAEIVDGVGGYHQLGGSRSVHVVGNTAYVAAGTDSALTIMDVTPCTLGLAVDGWVGIGTTTPRSAMEVAGTVTATTFSGGGAGLSDLNADAVTQGTLPDARLSGNIAKLNTAQTFTQRQTFGAGAALNDTDLLLRAGTDASHGIGWYGTGKTFEGIVMEGPVIYGYWGGALGSKNGGDSIALRWDERRRVGVGTATPDSPLTVVKAAANARGAEVSIVNNAVSMVGNEAALNFAVDDSTYAGDDANAQIKARLMRTDNRTDLIFSTYNGSPGGFGERVRIQADGNVGIGTASPQRTLHVSDVLRLQPRATAPTSPAKGDMYMDSVLNKLRVYDGTTWQNCW